MSTYIILYNYQFFRLFCKISLAWINLLMKFLATVNGPIVSFNCLETGPYCVSVISSELALFKYEHFLSVISLSNSDLVIHQLKLFLF